MHTPSPTGVETIDTDHTSVRLIAAHRRLSQTNNWQPIALNPTAQMLVAAVCRRRRTPAASETEKRKKEL